MKLTVNNYSGGNWEYYAYKIKPYILDANEFLQEWINTKKEQYKEELEYNIKIRISTVKLGIDAWSKGLRGLFFTLEDLKNELAFYEKVLEVLLEKENN